MLYHYIDDRDIRVIAQWLFIIGFRIAVLDAPSYITKDPTEIMASHEQHKKKKKYLDDCLQQRRSLKPTQAIG